MDVKYITPDFAVSVMPTTADFPDIVAQGFKSVLSNRPDGEDAGQLAARDEAVLAAREGLNFRHVPARNDTLFSDEVVTAMAEALTTLERPVLAHCKTGLRSAILWAAATARIQPVDNVLAALRAAGFDLDVLRDDLEAQAARRG